MKLLMQTFIYSGIQAVLRIINNIINIQTSIKSGYYTITEYKILQASLQNNQIVLVGYSPCSNSVAAGTSLIDAGIGCCMGDCITGNLGTEGPYARVGIYVINPSITANLTAYYSVIYLPSDIT